MRPSKKVSLRLQICVGHLQLSQEAVYRYKATRLVFKLQVQTQIRKYIHIYMYIMYANLLCKITDDLFPFFFFLYLINRKSCSVYSIYIYMCVCLPIFALTPSNRRFISKLSAPQFFIPFSSSHRRIDFPIRLTIPAILHPT